VVTPVVALVVRIPDLCIKVHGSVGPGAAFFLGKQRFFQPVGFVIRVLVFALLEIALAATDGSTNISIILLFGV